MLKVSQGENAKEKELKEIISPIAVNTQMIRKRNGRLTADMEKILAVW